MTSSLDKRSSNLKIDQFVNLKKYYSGNQLRLLLRKGVYPYDYVNYMEKWNKPSPKEDFILNSRVRVLQMKTTSMLKQFGRNLILSQWRITTTCTICLMYYYCKQSGNNFEVDFFKLMNNSVFGKTLKNIRNRDDIRLISSDKVAQKLAAKP